MARRHQDNPAPNTSEFHERTGRGGRIGDFGRECERLSGKGAGANDNAFRATDDRLSQGNRRKSPKKEGKNDFASTGSTGLSLFLVFSRPGNFPAVRETWEGVGVTPADR